MKYDLVKDVSEERFKTSIGVKKETFAAMLEVLHAAYVRVHSKHNGRHRQLSIENMLLATLEYNYEYRTQECIGASYGLSKQRMGDAIRWVENELIASGLFSLPGKKVLKDCSEIETIIVDTTETPVQRPKKGQRRYYSGKKTSYAEDTSGD